MRSVWSSFAARHRSIDAAQIVCCRNDRRHITDRVQSPQRSRTSAPRFALMRTTLRAWNVVEVSRGAAVAAHAIRRSPAWNRNALHRKRLRRDIPCGYLARFPAVASLRRRENLTVGRSVVFACAVKMSIHKIHSCDSTERATPGCRCAMTLPTMYVLHRCRDEENSGDAAAADFAERSSGIAASG